MVAFWPGVIVAIVLVGLVVIDPGLAGSLVREDGPVEWLQVLMAGAAIVILVRSIRRRFSPAGILGIAALGELIVSEIDLDQRVFGIPVIDWRFFRRATIPLPVRTLVAVVIIGCVTTFFVYAALRWRAIWDEACIGFREGWGWLLVAGLVLYGIPQPCDPCLNRVFPLPRNFLEESLELLGMLYILLGTVRYARCRAGTNAHPSDRSQ